MIRAYRRKRLVGRRIQPLKDHLIERIAVNGLRERFTHAGVLERIVRWHLAIIDIEGDALIPEAGHLRQRQLAVGFDGFNVAGSNALGQIEIARAQVRRRTEASGIGR